MDKRQLAPALALSRLVQLIDASPAFVEVARQSAAYEDLKQRVADLHDFVELYHTNVARRPLLREEMRLIRRQILPLAESILAAADLTRYTDNGWLAKMHTRPQGQDDSNLVVEVRSLVAIAREHMDELVRMGMLPRRPDHLDEKATRLDKLSTELRLLEAEITAAKQGYAYMVERARKTARVLFLQVQPLVTEQMLAEWRQALQLGRVNGRALHSRPQLALPNPQAPAVVTQTDVISLDAARPLSSAANE